MALGNLDLECIESFQQPPSIEECEIREILRQLGDLPIGVPDMPFTQLSCRVLNSDHFQTLVSQHKTQGSDTHWTLRLQKRRTNLEKYVGHYLLCVFIRLPMLHYTFEVDPIRRFVVHWEWQAG
jgi:hypothetical protein